jgi:prepilin-type N-terminal cleavage/methylation domain-containing protein
MKSVRMDNKGMTLLELMICFVLLGFLLLAGSQVIISTTQVYYYTKATDYGMQASQLIATEIRGDLTEAIMKKLVLSPNLTGIDTQKCIDIGTAGDSISFIIFNEVNGVLQDDGIQVSYHLTDEISDTNTSGGKVLVRDAFQAYDKVSADHASVSKTALPQVKYDTNYIGMNYKVKSISFSLYKPGDSSADTSMESLRSGDYPVIEMTIIVNNPQYGDYECKEYIPLYNYYGLSDQNIKKLIG